MKLVKEPEREREGRDAVGDALGEVAWRYGELSTMFLLLVALVKG